MLPDQTKDARFRYGRVRHTFDMREFGHWPPHMSLCKYQGIISTTPATHPVPACPTCQAICHLSAVLEADPDFSPEWLALPRAHTSHIIFTIDGLTQTACGRLVSDGADPVPSDKRHCPACESLLATTKRG